MDSSLKIGAVSGLIAGIVGGITFTLVAKIAISIGFFSPGWHPILPNAYAVHILLGSIFGIIGGVIYSKVYSLIPAKAILKGLFFGLILLLISWVRTQFFSIAYSFYLDAASWVFTGFFSWMAYGLVLALLYEFLRNKYLPTKEEPKVETYDVKSGILPGTISGLAGGIAAAFASVIGLELGLYFIPGGPESPTLDFFISQGSNHIWINMFWGVIFGTIFAKVYHLVPGKHVSKGIIFSLIIFFLDTFQVSSYDFGWD